MIFTGVEVIFSGLISGMIATLVMTATEVASWRK